MSGRSNATARLFVGGVWVLLGAVAALTAIVGIVMLISGAPVAGIIAIIIAAVIGVMAWSTGRSFRSL